MQRVASMLGLIAMAHDVESLNDGGNQVLAMLVRKKSNSHILLLIFTLVTPARYLWDPKLASLLCDLELSLVPSSSHQS